MQKDVDALLAPVRLITHDAVRIQAEDGLVAYVDPYDLKEAPHDADAVLVTHDHYDHFSPEDIARVAKPGFTLVVPTSLKAAAAELGAARVVVMRAGDEADLAAAVHVAAVPAYNVGKKFHPQANGWLGYVLTVDGVRYYHMGDTDRNPDVEHIPCDVLLIPVGGTYTMTAEEAAGCALSIAPRVAVPMHYGTVVGTPADGPRFAALLDAAQAGVASPIVCAVLMGE